MMLAAVLVRGMISASPSARETLRRLNLQRKNYLVLLEDTPSNRGMLKKAEGYVTYGKISEPLAKEIVEKKGEEAKELLQRKPEQKVKAHVNSKEYFGKKVKPYFRMSPPRKGYEKGGIKKLHLQGGALGFRREGMDSLVKRML